ncbi:MAG: hypothetical protein ABJN84_18250 [Flavobacteriaceae bacterium]
MKRKKDIIPILLLILFPLFSSSQKIKLSGEVYGYEVRHKPSKNKRLYFTFDEKPFKGQNYINYSSNFEYEWELNLDKIETDGIKELVFSTDTITNHRDEYSCVHRIRLDRILSSKRFRDKNVIHINCDLLLDFNCEETAYYGAREDGLERFMGTYTMIKDNETYEVVLKDFVFRYFSNPTKGNNINVLPEEYGSWGFDSSTKTLSFNVWIKRKKYFGLMKKMRQQYTFEVIENGDTILFKSNEYQLKKLHY